MQQQRSRYAYGFVLGLGLATVVAGCSTQPGTIWRTIDLSDGKSVSTGPRQRLVTNTEVLPTSRPGLVNPERIICAEPSPDVAIAVANSFGSGISVLGYGSGAVSGAAAENMAQLAERTVTVQLLRDQMYRACESYANGAISATTYSLLMSKNNDAMITLMLGETAGGAFGRSLAAIGTGASAEAQAAMQGLGAVTGDFSQGVANLTAANEKVDAAKEKLADKEKQQAEQPADATDAVKTKNQGEVDEAKKELAQAEAERDVIAESLQSKSEAAAKATAEVKELHAVGSIANRSSPEIAAVLEKMQANFLVEDFDDEYVSACIVELGLVNFPGQEADELETVLLKDSLNAVQNTQLDEREHVGSRKGKDIGEILKRRLATASAIVAQKRYSGLASHCQSQLRGFMDQALVLKYDLKFEMLEKETNVSQRNVLAEYNKAAKDCATIPNAAQQTQCRNTVAKLIDPSAKSVPVPEDPVGPGGPVLPLIAYEIAEEQSKLLATEQTTLKAKPVPAVKTGAQADPLKTEKEALTKIHADLVKETDALVAKAGQLLTAAKKGEVKGVDDQWGSLETQRRKAIATSNQSDAKRLTQLIVAQQIVAEQTRKTYDDLTGEMRAVIKKIGEYIPKVDDLTKRDK